MKTKPPDKDFLSVRFAEFFDGFDDFCRNNGDVVIKEYKDCIQIELPDPKKLKKPGD